MRRLTAVQNRLPQDLVSLSPRELQVLHLVASGLPNKLIAHELRITLATVKGYISTLCDAAGVESRIELTIWSLQNEDVYRGAAVPPGLHPRGCMCESSYCRSMVHAERAQDEAA